MTPADTNRIKRCKACGDFFRRPANGMRERDWLRKVYCDAECRRRGAEEEHRAAMPPANGDPLLRAVISYGLRHDGLPGLPAPRLIELATQLGVAA